MENIEAICGLVTAVILIFGSIAELTNNKSMSKWVKVVRTIWSVVPIGNRKTKNMGRTESRGVAKSIKSIFISSDQGKNDRKKSKDITLKNPEEYFK